MARPRQNFEGDICHECGINPVCSGGYSQGGSQVWKKICSTCNKARYVSPWLRFRGAECEMCGHVPMFLRVLHVHHRDGDKSNNEEYNLTTLCSNCHADLEGLIHQQSGDWESAENLFERIVNSKFNPFRRDEE